MKKKYESPLAEKYEFNYVENVVASPTGPKPDALDPGTIAPNPVLKEGSNINGCYTGSNANKSSCTPVYGS